MMTKYARMKRALSRLGGVVLPVWWPMTKGAGTLIQRLCILSFAALLLSGSQGQSAWADLGKLEDHFYSATFADEQMEDRLSRLESRVFGQPMSGSLPEREARLQQALKHVLNKPKQDKKPASAPGKNSLGRSETVPSRSPQRQEPPQVPDATDYPTITALEREVFSRDFIYDDITRRLQRLERKVFRQDYPKMALADRVDKLLMRYPNVRPYGMPDSIAPSPNSALSGLPDSSEQFVGSSRDTYAKLDALERAILGKGDPNALITERLDTLEEKMFERSYSGQTVDNRINRLIRTYHAGNNRAAGPVTEGRPPVQARPSTAARPSSGYAASGEGEVVFPGQPPPPRRQNIQIGAGLSEMSTYQFSPELINMLPNDVRNQVQVRPPAGGGGMAMGGGHVRQSTTSMGMGGMSMGSSHMSQGTTMGGGGTVIRQERTAYPGFQTFGGAPMQHQSQQRMGGRHQGMHSSTTLIPPPGAPVHMGDPTVLNELAQLEINLFGQPNVYEPVPMRLSRLEAGLIGQMYPTAPEAERLANLQRVYRAQTVGQLLGPGRAGEIGRQAGSLLLGLPLNPPGAVPAP